MRDRFYKVLPWVLGLAIGFLLFRPPVFLVELGWLAWVLQAGLLALALLAFAALMIIASLPRDVAMRRLTGADLPADMAAPIAEIEALGFRRVGAPWEVRVAPTATLVGLIHGDRPVYATVFRTGTMPAKVAFDFVSMLDGGRRGLTTSPLPESAVLPAGNRSFRQVLPGAPAARLFETHVQGLDWLARQGIQAKALTATGFEEDFRSALAAQRELVMEAPLRGTWLALWRAATRQVPFVGPLSGQPVAARQVGEVQTARPLQV